MNNTIKNVLTKIGEDYKDLIAQQAGMPHQTYDVWDSMICNFS